jgi:hypothetical protein
MPDSHRGLSDAALAVFAFAAYHQLDSGQTVSSVVRRDGAGHRADDAAVAELRQRELAEDTDDVIHFTAEGLRLLRAVIDGMRRAADGA